MDLSIQFANQRNYLDELFRIYPTIPEGIRDIDQHKWGLIEKAFKQNKKVELLKLLLSLKLFPIKDSYVAYLKRDSSAIDRNPDTVDRLSGRLIELGIDKIYERCTEPKETNRQIGPLFKKWIHKGTLGVPVLKLNQFIESKENAILDSSDKGMMDFAKKYFEYTRNKGLDFIGRFNNQYILGEAKFLTDYGGHQDAQFDDAMSTINTRVVKATIIGILDGVLYIKGKQKMYKTITTIYQDYNIMSALVLREFLYSI
jgi:hypothetical protein